jgi:hypothetical protein
MSCQILRFIFGFEHQPHIPKREYHYFGQSILLMHFEELYRSYSSSSSSSSNSSSNSSMVSNSTGALAPVKFDISRSEKTVLTP